MLGRSFEYVRSFVPYLPGTKFTYASPSVFGTVEDGIGGKRNLVVSATTRMYIYDAGAYPTCDELNDLLIGGDILIWDAETGKELRHLLPDEVFPPQKCCSSNELVGVAVRSTTATTPAKYSSLVCIFNAPVVSLAILNSSWAFSDVGSSVR